MLLYERVKGAVQLVKHVHHIIRSQLRTQPGESHYIAEKD